MNTRTAFGPRPETFDLDALLDDHLGPRRTAALVLLATAGVAQVVLTMTLLATEPDPLPTRTIVVFVAVAVGGLLWTSFAIWRLTTHRILLLRDRVIASAISTTLTLLAVAATIALAIGRGHLVAAGVVGVIAAPVLAALALSLRTQIRRHRHAVANLERLEEARPLG